MTVRNFFLRSLLLLTALVGALGTASANGQGGAAQVQAQRASADARRAQLIQAYHAGDPRAHYFVSMMLANMVQAAPADPFPHTPAHVMQIRAKLTSNPTSKVVLAELGDALHGLGHNAEVAHDFAAAERFHLDSFDTFSQSGHRAKTSWDDGTEHAREHIFQSIHDGAALSLMFGDKVKAEAGFERAYEWLTSSGTDAMRVAQGGRIGMRYANLVLRRAEAGLKLAPHGETFLEQVRAMGYTQARY